MNIKFGDLVIAQEKSKIKAGEGKKEGTYIFFTSSNTQTKYIDFFQYDKPALIFGTGGVPSVHYCDERFSVSTDCLVFYSKSNDYTLKSLYLFFESHMKVLEEGFHGAGLQHISKNYILNIQIPNILIDKQLKINDIEDKLNRLIDLKKHQLESFNELVKSRFIEMFGTVDDNPYKFPTATLKEVCYKITDGKHGGCEQEANSGYYYVGAREIYDGSIHYDTAPQITYVDFAKDYKRCNIERGDMVIVNTGATIGKTAIATSPLTEHTLLQKSVALLKVKTEIIGAEFLRHCYIANPSMYRVENASAQPNLLLSKMNVTRIYLPPLELQERFSGFIKQTDKSKFGSFILINMLYSYQFYSHYHI